MKPVVQKYDYKSLERVTNDVTGKRYYISPDGRKLSSVTTILSATKDDAGLKAWRDWVGESEANRIVKEATGLGSLMHEHLENWMIGKPRPSGNNVVRKMASEMADVIIAQGMPNVDEVWGIEEALYFPGLYAGMTDLVGVHKGEPAIMDYKTANKMKKPEHVKDYFLQGSAYALAHNEMFGTNLRKVVLFMVARDLSYKEWVLEGSEFDAATTEWFGRVDQFIEMKKNGKV